MEKFKIKAGFVFGQDLIKLFDYCKRNNCAIPAVNVTSSSTINAALSSASQANSPIIIQFSHSGAAFFAGNNLDNSDHQASVLGSASAAMYIKSMAQAYGVPVVLHSDHCPKEKLEWIDGLLDIGKDYYDSYSEPLFSSHMLDLSQLSLDENIKISKKYLNRLDQLEMLLEIEVGLTGGEEDGLDNSGANKESLYSKPADVFTAYKSLSQIGNVNIAAAFGNVHGVYKPGSVQLKPSILAECQQYAQKELNENDQKILNLVFHGGSGSPVGKIKEALKFGIVKFNIDTDTQWSFTKPIKEYMDKNDQYLHSQIGNKTGKDIPNKKQIDPRVWLYQGEQGMTDKLVEMYKVLNSYGKFEILD
ncbi:MAG: class II fructose-bisphosphate aldolase [Candidatus Pacebacteria bacterium]|nr:class II fructose-bisphosphate aldolase [Candidatus Paceibacterota bacterium]